MPAGARSSSGAASTSDMVWQAGEAVKGFVLLAGAGGELQVFFDLPRLLGCIISLLGGYSTIGIATQVVQQVYILHGGDEEERVNKGGNLLEDPSLLFRSSR